MCVENRAKIKIGKVNKKGQVMCICGYFEMCIFNKVPKEKCSFEVDGCAKVCKVSSVHAALLWTTALVQ